MNLEMAITRKKETNNITSQKETKIKCFKEEGMYLFSLKCIGVKHVAIIDQYERVLSYDCNNANIFYQF